MEILEWRSLEDTWNGTNLNFNHVQPCRIHMPSRIFPLTMHKLNLIMKKHQASKTSCRMNSMPCKVFFRKGQDRPGDCCQLREPKETVSQCSSITWMGCLGSNRTAVETWIDIRISWIHVNCLHLIGILWRCRRLPLLLENTYDRIECLSCRHESLGLSSGTTQTGGGGMHP